MQPTFRQIKHLQRLLFQSFCTLFTTANILTCNHATASSIHVTPHNSIHRIVSIFVCFHVKETTALLMQVPDGALCRTTPKCKPASRIMTLRDSVVMRLDCWHLAVDAHVPQTAVETIAGRLKRQTLYQSYITAHYVFTARQHEHSHATARQRATYSKIVCLSQVDIVLKKTTFSRIKSP